MNEAHGFVSREKQDFGSVAILHHFNFRLKCEVDICYSVMFPKLLDSSEIHICLMMNSLLHIILEYIINMSCFHLLSRGNQLMQLQREEMFRAARQCS